MLVQEPDAVLQLSIGDAEGKFGECMQLQPSALSCWQQRLDMLSKVQVALGAKQIAVFRQ